MKKILNLIKKNIFGIIICGIIFGSVGVYAGTKFYASDVSVNTPTGSSLGSNATLQDSLDELYSLADSSNEISSLKIEVSSLREELSNLKTTVNENGKNIYWYFNAKTQVKSHTDQTICSVDLTPGSYLIYFNQAFSANSIGQRVVRLLTTIDDWGTADVRVANQNNGITEMNITTPLILDKNRTLHFIASQDSGSTLTGSTICQVVKLG